MFDVAIIGNGASAVATLKALFDLSVQRNATLTVCIIGQISNMGYGFSYNEDNDYAIMNTPASNISINIHDPCDFIKWAKKNGFPFLGQHNVPRRIYGKYLYDKTMALSKNANITLFDAYVADINEQDYHYEIVTLDNKKIRAKYVVLCTGTSKLNDFYDLAHLPRYISNPYPLHKQLSLIDPNKDVLILGSGLTAIDISVYLYYQKHKGKIIFCSREGRLPFVKSVVKPYLPKWCKLETFVKIVASQGHPLSLRQLLRLVRRELKTVNCHWLSLFFPKEADSYSRFIEKVNEAKKGLPWLDLLIGIQHEIDQTWAYVKKEDKALFIAKYLPYLLKVIAPVPLINANILCELFADYRLAIVGGVTHIRSEGDEFVVQCHHHPSLKTHYIVNATGFSRHISLDDEDLNANLLRKAYIVSHTSGGIQVCPKTGRIGSAKNMFSVGHLTMGEHPLINNLEFIVINAEATAQAIVNDSLSECYVDRVASAF